MTRTIDMSGASITERLEELDEATHTRSHSIVTSPLPVIGYQAWISLSDAGESATATAGGAASSLTGTRKSVAKMVPRVCTGRNRHQEGAGGVKPTRDSAETRPA